MHPISEFYALNRVDRSSAINHDRTTMASHLLAILIQGHCKLRFLKSIENSAV